MLCFKISLIFVCLSCALSQIAGAQSAWSAPIEYPLVGDISDPSSSSLVVVGGSAGSGGVSFLPRIKLTWIGDEWNHLNDAPNDWFNPLNWEGEIIPLEIVSSDPDFVLPPDPEIPELPTEDTDVYIDGWRAVQVFGDDAFSRNLYLANEEGGQLIIDQGGALTSLNGFIGYKAYNEEGKVEVSDGSWQISNSLYVGYESEGELNINHDNAYVSSHDAFVGFSGIFYPYSIPGTVTISVGLWHTDNQLTVGVNEHANGHIIQTGGMVVNQSMVLGRDEWSRGEYEMSGGTLVNTGVTIIGETGLGSIFMTDGLVQSGRVVLGLKPGVISGGVGELWMRGGKWESSEDFYIGYKSLGELILQYDSVLENQNTYIGYHPDIVGGGYAHLDGGTWTHEEEIFIGYGGMGNFNLYEGTLLNRDGFIGMQSLATGIAKVYDGLWTNQDDLHIGYYGEGRLEVTGGIIRNDYGVMAADIGSKGDALISGGRWENSKDLLVGYYGDATLTLSGGIVKSESVYAATKAGSSGTINIGAAADGAASTPGQLMTNQIVFGAGDGKLVFNHTSDDYELDADISGPGSIDVYAGTTRLTGLVGHTGGTTIWGGLLIVNGSIGDLMLKGGSIGGSGSVSSITAVSGSTIRPGNSIGTLNVSGDVAFNTGSFYEVEVDDNGNSDVINASGRATIDNGVTLQVLPENGLDDGSSYDRTNEYTILTADGGVFGTFDSVVDSFLLLDALVTYEANNVILTLYRNDALYADIAQTKNQRSVAGGLDSAIGMDVLTNALAAQGRSDLLNGLDQLSGEIYSSTNTVLIEDSALLRDSIFANWERSYAYPKGEIQPWFQALGSLAQWDATSNVAETERVAAGFLLGGNYQTQGDWHLGFLSGYSQTNVDVSTRASSADLNSVHLGAYFGKRFQEFSLKFGVTASQHFIDSDRSVSIGGFSEKLHSDYRAITAQAFSEFTFLTEWNGIQVQPYGRLAAVHLTRDSIDESGVAALHSDSSSYNTFYTTLGIQASTQWKFGSFNFISTIDLGWQHALNERLLETEFQFADSASFDVAGSEVSRDLALLNLSIAMPLGKPGDVISLSCHNQLSDDAFNHAVKLTFSRMF